MSYPINAGLFANELRAAIDEHAAKNASALYGTPVTTVQVANVAFFRHRLDGRDYEITIREVTAR